MPGPPSSDPGDSGAPSSELVAFPSGVLATLGDREHVLPGLPLDPAAVADVSDRSGREPLDDGTPHRIFAVGLPTTAQGTLLRACATLTDEAERVPCGDALLPRGRRLPTKVDVRLLGTKTALDATLEFLGVEMAAGVVGENAERLAAESGDFSDGVPTAATPSSGDPDPPRITARSADTTVTSRRRPREFDAIRAVPTDTAGRHVGDPAANLDSEGLGRDEEWPAGPERGAAEPPVVFVDDVAWAVFPGPGPNATESEGRHPYDARNRWVATPVAQGTGAVELYRRYRRGWRAGRPVTVYTPPQAELVESVVATLGPAVGRSLVTALATVDIHVGSIRRRGGARRDLSVYPYPVLRFKQVLLLVAAHHGLLAMDLRDAVGDLSLVSESTLVETQRSLVSLGVLETEKSESDTPGPKPSRLVLGSAVHEDGERPSLETVLERAARVVAGAAD